MNLITLIIIIIVCAAILVEFRRQRTYKQAQLDRFLRSFRMSKTAFEEFGRSALLATSAFSLFGWYSRRIANEQWRSTVMPEFNKEKLIYEDYLSGDERDSLHSKFNKDFYMGNYENKTIFIPKRKSDEE